MWITSSSMNGIARYEEHFGVRRYTIGVRPHCRMRKTLRGAKMYYRVWGHIAGYEKLFGVRRCTTGCVAELQGARLKGSVEESHFKPLDVGAFSFSMVRIYFLENHTKIAYYSISFYFKWRFVAILFPKTKIRHPSRDLLKIISRIFSFLGWASFLFSALPP